MTRSELRTLENEIVRDLFISKMKNMTLQGTLTFETLDPEEILKRAIKFEHSKLTTMHFKRQMQRKQEEQVTTTTLE